MTNRDSLSPAFVSHVKILFDILDENHSGLVRLNDIESHWEGSECMIPGDIVVQSLRDVASPSGRLSFDTFTVGLQRALTVWKSSGTGSNNPITHSNENRGPAPGNATTRESVSIANDSSCFNSDDRDRRVDKSSAVSNGLLKCNDAACNNSAVTSRGNADGLKQWQHEETLAGHNGKYAYVHKSKGNQFIIIPRGYELPWAYLGHTVPVPFGTCGVYVSYSIKAKGETSR